VGNVKNRAENVENRLGRMTNVKGANDKGISNGQGQISRAVNLGELARLKVTCGSVVAHH
jgi:hypothetical protein